jgi:predicted permease
VIGRLKPGATTAQAEADLSAMQNELSRRYKGYPPGVGILVAGLQQDNTRTIRGSLWFLLGVAGVLLLIACVNAGSLIVGRNSHRAAEFAVRVALGCCPARLLQQITLEILVLFVLAGLMGLGLAEILVRAFVAENPFGVLPPGGIGIDGKALAVTTLLVCATSLIFGSLPAFRTLRTHATDALRSRAGTPGREHLRSRMAFVGIEFALSVVLLVSAALLISTVARINSEAPGFNTNDVLVASVSLPYRAYATMAEQERFAGQVMQNLQADPQVRSAGVALAWPFQQNGLNPVEIEGTKAASTEQMPSAAFLMAGPGYFDALGIPLLRGRSFNAGDRADTPVVAVINEELARQGFAGEDPIGRLIRVRNAGQEEPTEPWAAIVGVVGATRSVRYNQMQWDRYPAIYTSMFQQKNTVRQTRFDSEVMHFYVQSQRGFNARTIAAAIHEVDSNLPVGAARSTGEIVRELRAQPRLRAVLLGIFAVFTMVLAAVGVYGVMAQFVEQRRREIGIRMALGAVGANIAGLILRRTLALAAIGSVTGVAAIGLLSRVLRSFLYDLSPLDPLIFTGVIGLLTAIAIAASYVPARRAVHVEPVEALRAE